MTLLTHFDAQGQSHMVDVGHKPATHRIATAEGRIEIQAKTLDLIVRGEATKGDVLGVARIAGIQASKRASDLVPLCHPIALTRVGIEFTTEPAQAARPASVTCRVTAETVGPTGVEIEALVAVQVALLTIYDMCKAVDRGMCITGVRLLAKQGGRSGPWKAQAV